MAVGESPEIWRAEQANFAAKAVIKAGACRIFLSEMPSRFCSCQNNNPANTHMAANQLRVAFMGKFDRDYNPAIRIALACWADRNSWKEECPVSLHVNVQILKGKNKFKWGLTVALASVCAFLLGILYGYEKGVVNYITYDAPGRIAVYEAAMRSDNPKDALKTLSVFQARQMESIVQAGTTSPWLLGLPATNGMEMSYERYLPLARKYFGDELD